MELLFTSVLVSAQTKPVRFTANLFFDFQGTGVPVIFPRAPHSHPEAEQSKM